MPSIPLTVVWFAVLCGYLPYSLGFAFLNPIILTGMGFLGLLVSANVPATRIAILSSIATTTLAILMVNLTSGIPHLVLPSTSILLSSWLLSASSVLAATGIRALLLRRGYDEPQVRLILRLAFATLALAWYLNSWLPYDAKMWLASHTTNNDLIIFAMVSSAVFMGTWRLTR